jgi:hypothetical protein
MVANGEHVTCARVLRDAPLAIDRTSFPADLYVMPLAGYDIVLGTRWLGALGPIVWDLGSRRMTFHFQGRLICWTSVPASRPTTISATVASE